MADEDIKDPGDWVTGGAEMTTSQLAYFKSLLRQARASGNMNELPADLQTIVDELPTDDSITTESVNKANASRLITAFQEMVTSDPPKTQQAEGS